MAISQTVYYRERGLTLIEVLVALAIVAIALTAVIKAASQNIRSTHYLQQKTIALWVGQNVMNEVRLGLIKTESNRSDQRQMTTMLDTDWYWQLTAEDTPNPHIRKINVNVYTPANRDNDEASPLISLEGYQYRETK